MAVLLNSVSCEKVFVWKENSYLMLNSLFWIKIEWAKDLIEGNLNKSEIQVLVVYF